jgi:hypothetical protein
MSHFLCSASGGALGLAALRAERLFEQSFRSLVERIRVRGNSLIGRSRYRRGEDDRRPEQLPCPTGGYRLTRPRR